VSCSFRAASLVGKSGPFPEYLRCVVARFPGHLNGKGYVLYEGFTLKTVLLFFSYIFC
jgi:hypothetical protein